MPYPYPFQNAAPRSFIVNGGYCTSEDVHSLFKNISGYSTLDSDEITRRIADATVEIDRAIEIAYVTPVTGDANALTVLRLICSRLAAAIIHEVYYVSEEPAPIQEQWRPWAEVMLKDILDGQIHFFSAAVQNANELPQFPAGAGATMNPDNNQDVVDEQLPIFQRTSRGNLSSLGDLI